MKNNIENLKAILEKHNFTLDKFGHYKRSNVRVKMGKISFRIEVKTRSGWSKTHFDNYYYSAYLTFDWVIDKVNRIE